MARKADKPRYRNRIRYWRKLRDMTQAEVAEAAGMSPQNFQYIESGRNNLTAENMQKIAPVLKVNPSDLMAGGSSEALSQISILPAAGRGPALVQVVGEVQAGVWKEAFEWDPEERYTVPAMIDNQEYARACYGVVVAGDSMDQVYPEGTILLVMPLHDYSEALGQPKSGDRVIVRRSRHDIAETTVKELTIRKGGKAELHCRSNNPKFNNTLDIHWPFGENQKSNSDTVEIVGVVIGSYRMEKKL